MVDSALLVDLACGFFKCCGRHRHSRPGCAPGGAVTFLLLRQKKVTIEAASRSRRPLRYATGYAALLGPVGVPLELGLWPQTIAGPDPPSPALLADATRRGSGQPARLRRASRRT